MTPSAVSQPSVASAPGKVLLAGGYLVLDRAYTGLVFGLSARIQVVVAAGDGDAKMEGGDTLVVVKSPQFESAEWRYKVKSEKGDEGWKVEVEQIESPAGGINPFVHSSILHTLAHTQVSLPPTLRVTILADRSYYSNTPASRCSSSTSSQFPQYGVPLSAAHKTGLGSSAALTTAFCSSLLNYLSPFPSISPSSPAVEQTEERRRELHNLCQIAHCQAQGKVGSGFDVAAAVYGSCLYRRFSPALLNTLPESSHPSFSAAVRVLVTEGKDEEGLRAEWDFETTKRGVEVPRGYSMVMCDVDCGSESVGMAKQVLKWRMESPADARRIWDGLQEANDDLAMVLSTGDEEIIAEKIKVVRSFVREMGDKSGVPIEPESQTKLLDAASEVEGVVGGVVPGAGGYDAVVLLVRDDAETTSRLEKFLEEWSAEVDGKVRLLGVKGEMEGARIENATGYAEWL